MDCNEKDCEERLSYWNTRGLPKDLQKIGAGIFGKKLYVNWKEFQAWKEEIATCAEEVLEEWRCK